MDLQPHIEKFATRMAEVETELGDPKVFENNRRAQELGREYARLKELVAQGARYLKTRDELRENRALAEGDDAEMAEMAREEMARLEEEVPQLEKQVQLGLVPPDPTDSRNTIVEIRAGAGGNEAALFAGELYRMYTHYAQRHGWKLEVIDANQTGLGAIKEIVFEIKGKLMDQDSATIHRTMEINYGGVVNTVKATLPAMLERGQGDMVLFASMAGWQPVLLLGAYNASKFAVVAFNEVLAHENRNRGVRFACVCPPVVATPLLDQAKDAWPKIFDEMKPIDPQTVLDTIEKTLDDGSFWVFPGKTTRMGWRMRRWFPQLGWKQIHKIEGW